MIEDIKWLIDEYQHEINELEESRREDSGIGMSNAYITGKIRVYARVVADLEGLLESEEEE